MACSSCNTGNCGCTDLTLPVGGDGAQGVQGEYGGFSTDLLFSTSTSTGPTSGQLRLDNATSNLVTNIYVSDTNGAGRDIDSFLDSFSNGGSYGIVRIFKESDSTKFWYGTVTAVTDNGTDHTIAVTYIGASHATVGNIFSASDSVVITFSPRGNTGSSGGSGSTGAQGIYGGYSSDWLFDSTASGAAPAATFAKFDAAPGSATTLLVSETNASSTDLSAFLTSFTNNGNYGYVRVFKKSDSNVFWYGTITSATDVGTARSFAVTLIQTNGTFSNNDPIVVSFTPKASPVDTGYETAAWDSDVTLTAGTSKNTFRYTYASGAFTTTSADRTITLVPSTTPGVNNNFRIILDIGRVPATNTWKIMYGATTLAVLKDGSTTPTAYDCYWNGTSYTVTRTPIETNSSTIPDMFFGVRFAVFDIDTSGSNITTSGVQGSFTFPVGSIIMVDKIIIHCDTALTGGAASIKLGYSGGATPDDDCFLPLTALGTFVANYVGYGNPTAASIIKMTETGHKITATSNASTVTSGKLKVYVPYIIDAQ